MLLTLNCRDCCLLASSLLMILFKYSQFKGSGIFKSFFWTMSLLISQLILVLIVLYSGISVQSYIPSTPPPNRQPSSSPAIKSTIIDITSPDDLQAFVVKDDRPAVIKVYSHWCRTCRQFDMRYKNLALNWGEQNNGGGGIYSNRARFAQMEYSANEEICKLLKATKVPYILIYKRSEGEVARFACPPSKMQLLIDALHEHASPLNDDLLPMSLSEEPTIEPLMEDDSIESTLMKGSEMMDALMPEIQKQAGYDSISSFEEFCKKHTTKKK